MIRLKQISIRNRLIAIQLFTAFLVLLMFSIFLIYNQMKDYRRSVEARLVSLAKMISGNCISAIDFGDPSAAEDVLRTLEAESDIVNAWITDAKGKLFASYSKKSFESYAYPTDPNRAETQDPFFVYSSGIVRDKESLGVLHLRYRMSQYQPVFWENSIMAGLILALGMVLSLGLAVLTQRSIASPILQLAKTVRAVSLSGDFSVRVEKGRNDEIGILCEGFNNLLQQIQTRIKERDAAESALQKAYDGLESKVAERTAELASANSRLQELDRLKSMFMASMSHELRTPLNSIIGFTGLLLMGLTGELNAEQKTQLGMVKSSAQHLLSLINDILDISKIESGRVQLVMEEFDLHQVVEEVVSSLHPQADKKGLALVHNSEPGLLVTNDRRRVKQILMNLVTNAVKFTDEGSVKVVIDRREDQRISLSVRDTGIGIAPEDMEKLFQPFQQIDMTSTKRHEGTGLGLYLCSKLMEMLQGEVKAESRLGEGSMFTMSIPLRFQEGATR